MNGVLNIDKPPGMTSHDVVNRIRHLARLKRVGHAGTLDPDATGVLLVCLGQATRIADYLAAEGKAYRSTLSLGSTTTTEDASGETLTKSDAGHLTRQSLAEILPRFVGDIAQTPPMVSAVHHEGRRLYELAREGITVERAARTIHIDSISMVDFTAGETASATLEVACGKGTYIRTLCADIGVALGVGGHMATLRRTQVGAFAANTATPLADLNEENLPGLLVSAADALGQMPAYQLRDEAELDSIRHGRPLMAPFSAADAIRILDSAGELIALGRADGERLHPFKVFTN